MLFRTGFAQYALFIALAVMSCVVRGVGVGVVADGTLGTTVNFASGNYAITDGTLVGNNLFHSFSEFGIASGQSATFSGSSSVDNILGRVTGGAASNINGLLRSTIGGANLYLINPAGVMFGPDASLDVSGSFYVSTANYISLDLDGRFDATNPAGSTLTVSAPSEFGFLSAPAPISFTGSALRAMDGERVAVIGGDITLTDASIFSNSGKIDVVSLAGAGQVNIAGAAIETSAGAVLGTLDISQSTDTSGRPVDRFFTVGNLDVSGTNPGTIVIRAGRFVADNALVYGDTRFGGGGKGGHIDIKVDGNMTLANESIVSTDSVNPAGPGEIEVDTGSLKLVNGSSIQSRGFVGGPGGSIDIQVDGVLEISGISSSADPRLSGDLISAISGQTIAAGNGSDIDIVAGSIRLYDSGEIVAGTSSGGDSGVIRLDVNTLRIDSGGGIHADTTGAGRGGDITINATGTVSIAGASADDPADVAGITASAFSSGNGGAVVLNAQGLSMGDRSVIQTNLESAPGFGQPVPDAGTRGGEIIVQVDDFTLSGGAQITALNLTDGQGGDVTVAADNTLSIRGQSADGIQASGLFTSSGGSGAGGNLFVAANTLLLSDSGSISSAALGSGAAGNIKIAVSDLSLQSGGRISSSAGGAGAGGDLVVAATNKVSASGIGGDGFGSGVYSDVQVQEGLSPDTASGNGGRIDLSATQVHLSERASISAKSEGTGDAGSISVHAVESIVLESNSSITTEAEIAGGGQIDLQATDLSYLIDSSITSSVNDGTGNGGDITIDPVFVILNNSQIIANAFAGNGGNISIVADYFIASQDSIVQASSQLGIDGNITIISPDQDVSDSLTVLTDSFLDASRLMQQRCAQRVVKGASQFVVAGAEGLPVDPDDVFYAQVPVDVPGAEKLSREDLLLVSTGQFAAGSLTRE